MEFVRRVLEAIAQLAILVIICILSFKVYDSSRQVDLNQDKIEHNQDLIKTLLEENRQQTELLKTVMNKK